jgi:hypothetical protein
MIPCGQMIFMVKVDSVRALARINAMTSPDKIKPNTKCVDYTISSTELLTFIEWLYADSKAFLAAIGFKLPYTYHLSTSMYIETIG